MRKTGLKRYETVDVETFTTNVGLKLRRIINPLWRRIIRVGISRNVNVETYPKLDKKKTYVFVANHSFDEDVISLLTTIDRNAYLLHGSTNQMEHNPIFWAVWFNGMIYVNRMDKTSRSDALKKMERVLKAGNSVLLFPEGGYNNTENQLIMPLFSSPYILSKKLGVECVPIITFNAIGSKEIYIRAGNPIDIGKYEKEEGMALLRDAMATILYEVITNHTCPVKRLELGNYCREQFMEQRKSVYECQKWYDDVWEEELTKYSGHGVTAPQKVREYADNVQISGRNADILADVLVRRQEDKKYDLENYLRRQVKLQK